MNALPMIDMHEATRLTREGRLSEAMALLLGGAPRGSALAKEQGPQREQENAANVLDMQPPAKAGGAWASPAPASSPKRKDGPVDGGLRPGFCRNGVVAGKATARPGPLFSGGRFEDRIYADRGRTLAFKLYIPSGFKGQPLPLVVMLHGCTQSPDDFAAGTQMNAVAEEHLFLVAYPAQPPSANPQKCWNWFNAGDQRRDQGEPSLIAGITRQIMREFPVEEGLVYIAGLSAGGAAAAIMGSAYPDLYAAIGVHSGLACGAAKDMPSAFSAMRQGGNVQIAAGGRSGPPVPTIVFHGDRDTTVSAINGDQVIAQSKAGVDLSIRVSAGQTDGGIAYTRTVHSDAAERPVLEQWVLHGAGHAWSGGSSAGSYTEPGGPDASREMVRFFLQHRSAVRA